MSVLRLIDKNFEKRVLKNKLPILVDFFAEWCGPCRMVEPVMRELAEEYKDKLVIGKLDIDKNVSLAGKYGVMSIPTVILFKDGEEVGRKVGFAGKDGYEEMIKRVVK